MSKGIFTDRNIKPTARMIDSAIGEAVRGWKELNDFLSTTMKLKGELKFYGVNYGWAIRYAKSGKSVIALYPAENSFTAQIIMKHEQVEAALKHRLSVETKAAMERAHNFKEGRWVYLDIGPSGDIKDVETLVSVRVAVC